MSKALEKAQAAVRAKREAGEQIIRLNPAEKLARNPTSLRLAINARCYDCVGAENADHGFRRAIRECPAAKCALHNVRPYQRSEADDESTEAEGT